MLTLSSSRVIFLGNSTVALMSDDEFGDMTLISSINCFEFFVFMLNSCMLHVVEFCRASIIRFVSFVEVKALVYSPQKSLKH
jgi:hypothetical protein